MPLFSCKKEEPISETPSIEFVEVSPRQVVAFQEKLIFTISYTDGDGDLGKMIQILKTYS